MTPKELLCEYQIQMKEIKRLHDEAQTLRDLAENTTVDPTREKIQTSGSKDRLGDITAKMADIDCEILDRAAVCLDMLEKAENLISKLDNIDERLILQSRYINGLSWRKVEEQYNYSRGGLMKIHATALKKLGTKVDI